MADGKQVQAKTEASATRRVSGQQKDEPPQKRLKMETENGYQNLRKKQKQQSVDHVSTSRVSVSASEVDQEYFRGYGSIQVHEEMLADTIRTNAYRYAILKNYPHLYRGCVMDVGAGTGVLSVFAAQAGARKVYAIEASEMSLQARLVVKENNMADRIEVINKLAEDAEILEKVDAIISEWMGYCLLYESMLPSVLRARDKFLKPGGLMFPCQASLYLAPVNDEDYLQRLDFWREMKDTYKVSMDCMAAAAHSCLSVEADVKVVPQEAVQAHAVKLFTIDLMSATSDEVQLIQSPFCFKCFGHSTITGFVSWFLVEFPGGTTLTTSPYQPETHWGQTVMYLQRSFPVQQDTKIEGRFKMASHSLNHRCMEMTVDFSVDDGEQQSQTFSLQSWGHPQQPSPSPASSSDSVLVGE